MVFKQKERLNIALVQTDIVWGKPKENLAFFSHKLTVLPDKTDLVVLPEMFSTGFTMNVASLSETMDGFVVKWMRKMASQFNFAITGSAIIKVDKQFYNRLLFVHPDGKIDHYDKRHTFSLADEDKVFTSGKERLIINYKGWSICPLICYDLRFPVWSRNNNDYDLLVYVASWPKVRIDAWNCLLKARAIENMSYVVGVNRVGEDANSLSYSGCSSVYDFLGNSICKIEDKEEVMLVSIDKSKQDEQRNFFGFLNDRDLFSIK